MIKWKVIVRSSIRHDFARKRKESRINVMKSNGNGKSMSVDSWIYFQVLKDKNPPI